MDADSLITPRAGIEATNWKVLGIRSTDSLSAPYFCLSLYVYPFLSLSLQIDFVFSIVQGRKCLPFQIQSLM